MSVTDVFRASRDQLLALRGEHERAVAEFRWPRLEGPFNWAVDWFDVIARGNDATALAIVEDDGTSSARTFAELSTESDQLAAWLMTEIGVRRGDPVILMLGNQIELWESMLAVMKIGAVIMPTTTAVGPDDLVDRIGRGGAKHVVCNAADVAKFDAVPGDYTRVSVGPAEGWADLRAAFGVAHSPLPHPGTAPDDPLLLYFTSGTTSRPKLVAAHADLVSRRAPVDDVLDRCLRPGDVHLNISSPGWAKHAWSCFFAPWIAEATVLVYNYRRFEPTALLDQLSDTRRHRRSARRRRCGGC